MSNRDELAGMLAGVVNGPETGSPITRAMADAILAAGYRKPRTIGYVVVDVVSKALDWDGEMHPSEEAAIESLTGPHQMWCKSAEEETEDRTFWGSAYMICAVEATR
jgi:hypothetical protein